MFRNRLIISKPQGQVPSTTRSSDTNSRAHDSPTKAENTSRPGCVFRHLRNAQRWVYACCYECGANVTGTGKFFEGLHGLRNHFFAVHKIRWNEATMLDRCIEREVDEAYVESITMNPSLVKKHYRSTAVDTIKYWDGCPILVLMHGQ